MTDLLLPLYHRLLSTHGPQNWWPAESPFEMIVGAYLTQNTAWRNVDLALANLRAARKLSPSGIRDTPLAELEQLIRPSGFFRQKAARLLAFTAMLDHEFSGDLALLLATPTDQLRTRLLALPGVGRETADSILLYAAHRPVFIIDLYTRRLLHREQIYPDALTADYDILRQRIETAFATAYPDHHQRTQVFNEFHALIVAEGKARPYRPLQLRHRIV
ncbi:MAG: endonuclease III domain-containing protein [Acidobacteriaceae bacterium]